MNPREVGGQRQSLKSEKKELRNAIKCFNNTFIMDNYSIYNNFLLIHIY